MSAIKTHCRNFWQDTSGAITVEWTLVVAAGVAIGLATMTVVGSGLETSSSELDETMSDREVFSSLWEWGDEGGYGRKPAPADPGS